MGTLRLTLLRHGHAEPFTGTAGDFVRELTARGRAEAAASGERLAREGLVPDLVLASSAQRTRSTAQLAAAAAALPPGRIHSLDALYNASADHIWQVATVQAGTARHVLVCGHNPGISQLASRLAAAAPGLPRRVDLPPAGLVTATWSSSDWTRLDLQHAIEAQLLLP